VYTWLVSLSIFWFLYRVLEPYGLKIVGQMLGLAMIFTLIVLPVVRLIRFLVQPARAETVNRSRAAISFGAIAVAATVVLLVPLPYHVSCSFEIQPRGASSVYVDVPGELRAVYSTSGSVAAGQPLAELEDVEARLTEEQLVAQGEKLAARIESIRQRALTDDQALLELSQTEEARAAVEKQLSRLRQDLAKLTIRAPAAGTIVPPPARPANEADRTRLAAWSGRPLEVRNVGSSRRNWISSRRVSASSCSWRNCRARSSLERSNASRTRTCKLHRRASPPAAAATWPRGPMRWVSSGRFRSSTRPACR
jgi:putative peptide zinc metalloprotease protein